MGKNKSELCLAWMVDDSFSKIKLCSGFPLNKSFKNVGFHLPASSLPVVILSPSRLSFAGFAPSCAELLHKIDHVSGGCT